MKYRTIRIDLASGTSSYDISIGDGLISKSGDWARRCLSSVTAKIAIVSNPTVFALYGRQTEKSLRSAGFSVSHFLMKDGERFKDLRTAEDALRSFATSRLSRTDAVIALGGGVVGDMAGFAAAVYLRGIPFLQVPTTLLAMIDASVGGKTGVNTTFGKNLMGAFHQPRGVLIDPDVLATLPRRETTAGFCEAIKQGAIGGKKLLGQTEKLLSDYPVKIFSKNVGDPNFKSEISNLISSHVEFKAGMVAKDPYESSSRTDARSRKILNFGHTFAHALERVTNYNRFRHGEAVGHGILFAAELSKTLALLAEKDVRLLYDVVHRAGPLPPLVNIDEKELFDVFRSDKKNIAGSLQMVLLKGIGKPVVVSEQDIPRPVLKRVLKEFLQDRA